jgi:uncharacterized membrane protein
VTEVAATPARILPHLPVAALIVAYGVRFSLLSVSVHDGYGTPAYDMGVFDQGIWLLSRFHAPFVTIMGRNLFGDHTSFILVLVVPLYWIYPHAQLLLVLQSCLLAGAAIPIYLLARRWVGSTVCATALAATYLLNPALQNGNLEQFHPEAFLVFSVAVAIYAAVESRPRLLAVAVVASLLVKEDTALLMIPLGLWVAWRRNRRWGLWIVVGAAAYLLVAYKLVIGTILGTAAFYNNRIPFGGFGGSLRTLVRHPGRWWDYVQQDKRPWYVWQLAFSVGWGFLIAPEIALIGIGTLAENTLSTFPYMHQILYHYSLPLVPVLALGTVYGVAHLATPRRRQVATAIVTVCALWACVLWGLAPFSRQTYPHWDPSSPQVAAINTVERALPANAVVSAYYPYVSHLDHRTRIYLWPTPFRAEYWDRFESEGQRLPFADQIQYLMLPTDLSGPDAAVFASIAKQFRVVKQAGDVAVYQRIAA